MTYLAPDGYKQVFCSVAKQPCKLMSTFRVLWVFSLRNVYLIIYLPTTFADGAEDVSCMKKPPHQNASASGRISLDTPGSHRRVYHLTPPELFGATLSSEPKDVAVWGWTPCTPFRVLSPPGSPQTLVGHRRPPQQAGKALTLLLQEPQIKGHVLFLLKP